MKDLKIKGYTNTWSECDKMCVRGNYYYLLENDVWGDETCYLIIDSNKNLIGETFDDLYTGLVDYGVII